VADEQFKQKIIAFDQELAGHDRVIADLQLAMKDAKDRRKATLAAMRGFIQDETRPILRLQLDDQDLAQEAN
jgi:hypothetical protein